MTAAADPAAAPSQVTVIQVDDRLPASADVATAIDRAPGTVVRRLGGLGDLAQVGIRGASARQTEVLLDGLPLNPEGGSAVDLSELPLRAFERIEVYRGAPPALLGTTGAGGAVNLVTGDHPVSRTSLGAGSFGTARATAAFAGPVPVGDLWFAADGLATGGAYPYFDDRGTRFDPSDDRTRLRENNDTRQLATSGRWRTGDPDRLRLSVLHAGLWRDEGVPGFVSDPTASVRYTVGRQLAAGRLDAPVGAGIVGLRGYGTWRDESLSDPGGEIGVGTSWTVDRTRVGGLDATGRWVLGPATRLEAGVGGRVDRFSSEDVRTSAVEAGPGRETVRAVLGVPLVTGRVAFSPAVSALGLVTHGPEADPSRVLVLPRAGVAIDAGNGLWLKATGGAYARPPDPVELFGDRGPLVGNPSLRPERGSQADLGASYRAGDWTAEAVGFVGRAVDGVVWTQGAQGVARPENVDRVDSAGLEASVSARSGPLELASTATAMRAEDRGDDPATAGRALPRVPALDLWTLAALDPGWLRLQADLSVTAGTWADRANLARQPARPLVGATAAVRDRSRAWAAELDVRNLLDTRVLSVARDPLVDDGVRVPSAVVDFTGYPLPGRTWMLSVRFEP